MSFEITGRNIEGEINRGYQTKQVPQATAEEFLEVIDEILDTPGLDGITWAQYTPYFNDGDVFGLNQPRAVIDGEEYDSYDTFLTGEHGWYDRASRSWKTETVSKRKTEILDALRKFRCSEFEEVCRNNFGEHAKVTATKNGFEVEYYEHG